MNGRRLLRRLLSSLTVSLQDSIDVWIVVQHVTLQKPRVRGIRKIVSSDRQQNRCAVALCGTNAQSEVLFAVVAG